MSPTPDRGRTNRIRNEVCKPVPVNMSTRLRSSGKTMLEFFSAITTLPSAVSIRAMPEATRPLAARVPSASRLKSTSALTSELPTPETVPRRLLAKSAGQHRTALRRGVAIVNHFAIRRRRYVR